MTQKDTKLSGLPTAQAADSAMWIPCMDSGVMKKVSVQQIVAAVPVNGQAPDSDVSTPGADVSVQNVADVTIGTLTPTIAAGEVWQVESHFTILNNSGATRVYTITLDFGGLFDIEIATGALASSATLIHPFYLRAVLDVRSTSLAYAVVSLEGQLPAGMASGADTAMAATHLRGMGWGTTASNATGAVPITLKCRSANAAATQTFRLHQFKAGK